MKKQNKSDFTIAVAIKDFTGHIIDYVSLKWTLDFYVRADKKIIASCENGVLSDNCEILTETDAEGNPIVLENGDTLKKVIVYVDGFDWGYKGAVNQNTNVFFPNSKFSDGFEKATDSQIINLVIE